MQHLVLPSGHEADLTISVVNNVSISYRLTNLSSPEDIVFWRQYSQNLAEVVLERLLENFERLNFAVSADATYVDNDQFTTQEISRVNKRHSTLYRNATDRDDKINTAFDEITEPGDWANAQGTHNYSLQHIDEITGIGFAIGIPFVYNARAMSADARLATDLPVSNFISFIPTNSDGLCILHSIFHQLFEPGPSTYKSLNKDAEYMRRFSAWVEARKLLDFYVSDNFCLDDMGSLEERLETNLNMYTLTPEGTPELYYRSTFRFTTEPINLVVIGMNMFYNRKSKLFYTNTATKNGVSVGFKDLPFFTNISTTRWLDCKLEAHAVVLNPNYFRKRGWDGLPDRRYRVCMYCTASCTKEKIEDHQNACLKTFQGCSMRDRIREYKELKDPVKKFKNFAAQYRTPFCTFDFETRLVKTEVDGKLIHKHVPYSYSIVYLNIFDLKKSKIVLECDEKDPEALLEKFLSNMEEIVVHHHDVVQSVDHAPQDVVAVAEKPTVCPWCKQEAVDWEYNHSHFQGDLLNDHLDGYICLKCNKAATIRNKPLKFYAHNGSKFDFSLILPQMFNDGNFKGFKFLAKTESRFTEVSGYIRNDVYKFILCDSRMQLSDGIAKLAGAWVNESDDKDISTLLELFYKAPQPKEVIQLSRRKAVFPYESLNFLDQTIEQEEPLERKWFYDNLSKREVTEEDYQSYLDAHQILKKAGPTFCHGDYHDFYLALDSVILALVLRNFQTIAYENTGLNPLFFVSSSSFSMQALLKHNLENRVPDIVIPKVEVQKYLQKSIKGGFTMVFNKNLKDFSLDRDFSYYLDVNSLYPSVMATVQLPTRFDRWVENPSVEYMRKHEDDYYFFAEVDIAPLAVEHQHKVSNYPLLPENILLTPDMLSEDQLFRYSQNGGKGKPFQERLINTVSFFEKKNMVVSWSYLKIALEAGYEITKVHKIAQFEKDFVLKGYIDKMYTLKREGSIQKAALKTKIAAAETVEEKATLNGDLAALESQISTYKLILNAIYGQCIINSDLHSDVSMNDIDDGDNLPLKKMISSLRFKSLLCVGDKAVVSMQKSSYDLPYALMIGSATLFESKCLMAKFVYSMYDWLHTMSAKDLSKPPISIRALATDTDSYMFQVSNIRQHISTREEFGYRFNTECYSAFDTTGYPEKYDMPQTHEALCHFKSETKGNITEFNGLCAKCYSLIAEGDQEMLKGKGLASFLQKKYLSNKIYRDVINGTIFGEEYKDKKLSCTFGTINSKQMVLSNSDTSKSLVTIVDLKSYYSKNAENHHIFGSVEHLEATKRD